MKTTIHAVLSVFFVVSLVTLTACNPKQALAAPSAPDTPAENNAQTVAAVPAAAAGLAGELATFGFHVFPQPVELPVFAIPALAGTTLNTPELAGTVTLFNFWATWCPPCKKEMPSIERLSQAMKGTAFRIVAVSTGEKRETVESFIKQNKYTFPIYLDENGSLGASFASQGIPTTYVLDKSGKIIAGIVGSREYDDPALVSLLKRLAAQ